MKTGAAIVITVGMLTCGSRAQDNPLTNDTTTFLGMAHASAAVMVDDRHMLTASDEDNVLRLYALDKPGAPLAQFDWSPQLGLGDEDHDEVDIEGAAQVGDCVFWIGSHGRNRNGKWRPNRHRLFATRLERDVDHMRLVPVATSRTDLATSLLESGVLAETSIPETLGRRDRPAPSIAPKLGGFNIEGLAGDPDGGLLWIGLRSPLEKGRAVLIALRNPLEFLTAGASPMFDPIVLLDLDGLGIRDMVYLDNREAYIILAGAPGGGNAPFALYRWSGHREDPAHRLPTAMAPKSDPRFNPEVVLPAPDGGLYLVSDDGQRDAAAISRKNDTGAADAGESAGASFRMRRIALP